MKIEKKNISNKNVKNKIEKALEKIRPSLQMDGGDVKLVDFDDKTGIAKVQLVGMCAHCPMSQVTLKDGIEVEVKKEVKEVKEVVSV